jgi:polysaccharide export outer membrane protein
MLLLGGCARRVTTVAAPVPVAGAADPYTARPITFRFQVGDEVAVHVWKEPDLTTQQRVHPDGSISPMLLGTVPVVGLTPDELRLRLADLYREYLKDPKVSVRVIAIHSDRVFILGEVKNPQAIPLVGPTTVMQGIAQAGGFMEEFAEKRTIRVIRAGPNGAPLIYVLDGQRVLAARGGDLPLQRGDVVYVPARGVTNWARTVGQALSPLSTAIGTAGAAAAVVSVANDND